MQFYRLPGRVWRERNGPAKPTMVFTCAGMRRARSEFVKGMIRTEYGEYTNLLNVPHSQPPMHASLATVRAGQRQPTQNSRLLVLRRELILQGSAYSLKDDRDAEIHMAHGKNAAAVLYRD